MNGMDSFWDNNPRSKDPNLISTIPLSDELIAEIEKQLGFKLPEVYIQLCKLQNGGEPKNRKIKGFSSLDNIYPIDLSLVELNDNLSDHCNYPRIGIYFASTVNGHSSFGLDYRACGRRGEPVVVNVDDEFDYRIAPVAKNMKEFLFTVLQPRAKKTEQFRETD